MEVNEAVNMPEFKTFQAIIKSGTIKWTATGEEEIQALRNSVVFVNNVYSERNPAGIVPPKKKGSI